LPEYPYCKLIHALLRLLDPIRSIERTNLQFFIGIASSGFLIPLFCFSWLPETNIFRRFGYPESIILIFEKKLRTIMEFIAVIPARYQSTRFPGKPLAVLGNKPIIQWVYENVAAALDEVWVATDDQRILEAVRSFGGKAILTAGTHKSGTDRCAEAATILEQGTRFDGIINVQGDEPFIRAEQIRQLMDCFREEAEIATLIKEVESAEELFNPNRPKVVLDNERNAMYFSRSPIPFIRGEKENNWLIVNKFWTHIGMYAYKKEILQEITRLSPGRLERMEALEQLRWLENGYRVKTAVTSFQSIGIDTPEDLQTAADLIRG